MADFITLLVIALFLAGLVFVFSFFQGKQYVQEQTQRQKLALRASPTYQQMLDSEHRRHMDTQKLALQERDQRLKEIVALTQIPVTQYGLLVRSDIEAAWSHIAPVRVSEIKPEQAQIGQAGIQYPIAPPFASIKSQIKPGKLILGYNMQGPIYGDVSDLLSMLFAGKPNTGKSTALLYYLSMLLLTEASVYVFDHQGSLNELADFLPYFGEFKNFAEPMPTIYQELREREEIWRDGRQVRKPMLILADELPAVARYEEKNRVQFSLLELAEEIVLEHRKHNVYCLLTGQSFPAEVLPTITRDNCSSRVLFNSSDSHARMAGLDQKSRQKILPLLKNAPQGTAILDVTRRPEPDIVAIPYTTVEDARNAIGNGNMFPSYQAVSDVPESSGTGGNIVPVSSEERERIIELRKSGIPRREICTELGVGKWFYDTVKAVLDEEGL